TWDGGNGEWKDAKWNGGQTSSAALGRDNGTENGHHIVVGSGAQVFYDSAANGDFRLKSANGPTHVEVRDGAVLTLASDNTDDDGKWTEWDGDMTLDNGTLKRTHSGTSLSSGLLMFGSWRSIQDQEIRVNIKNGGRLENDGQVWFGADEDHALGLKVLMEIDDGTLDLTGGDYPQVNNDNIVQADLAFFYGSDFGNGNGATTTTDPKGETYKINFTGPGSITVDEAGVWVYDQDSTGLWTSGQVSYQDLWDRGILQANGITGAAGTFGDYFSVTGTPGAANYTLTSLLGGGGGSNGDYDGDSDVDGNDFLAWQKSFGNTVTAGTGADGSGNGTVDAADLAVWQGGFGGPAAAATAGAVPEPATLVGALLGLGCLALRRARRGA
ncbi:MAG: PEP-CTERM sorting domain-containing protein, partial [Pirellulales bacterium]|nr:PEP-CTERM sorting domain-containing protein [Pirellulales bacterium]